MYSEHLDLTTLNELLRTKIIGRATAPNEVWEQIDSTNTRAIALAADAAPHGVIIASRQQSAGRGRQGRTWISPPDAGLYISFLLRPQTPLANLPLISLGTGVAVAQAIESTTGIAVGLKWVNDIVLGGKKLGGILAEMPTRDALIIGCGLNLRRHDELHEIAIALDQVSQQPVNSNQLAAAMALTLEDMYSLFVRGEKTRIIDEWKKRSVTLGKEIKATLANEIVEGIARDVDTDGSLILQTESGTRNLYAGEISIRLADGSYA